MHISYAIAIFRYKDLRSGGHVLYCLFLKVYAKAKRTYHFHMPFFANSSSALPLTGYVELALWSCFGNPAFWWLAMAYEGIVQVFDVNGWGTDKCFSFLSLRSRHLA